MAELTAAQRKRIPSRQFGEPSERKYPMPDKAHAKNAKARASQAYREGRISKTERDRIYRKADLMLYGGHSRSHGHVYLVDESGKGAPRSRVHPDGQPQYKMRPETGRRRRAAEQTKKG